MEPRFSIPILLVGLARMLIWLAGAALAYHRRRWAVTLGFALAGATSVVFSITSAHGHLPRTVVELSSIAATGVAGIIVFAFISNQPRGARRPPTWTP